MRTNLPTGDNQVANLGEFNVTATKILDFGRYVIRVCPQTGTGWYRSTFSNDHGDLTFETGKYSVLCTTKDLPQQVRIALVRAGYGTTI